MFSLWVCKPNIFCLFFVIKFSVANLLSACLCSLNQSMFVRLTTTCSIQTKIIVIVHNEFVVFCSSINAQSIYIINTYMHMYVCMNIHTYSYIHVSSKWNDNCLMVFSIFVYFEFIVNLEFSYCGRTKGRFQRFTTESKTQKATGKNCRTTTENPTGNSGTWWSHENESGLRGQFVIGQSHDRGRTIEWIRT